MAIAAQSGAQRGGLASAELVQKIAGLVVDAMGDVVEDADGMNREWFARSRQLCAGLNTIALPLGSLQIVLSRRRSLIFKVCYATYANVHCVSFMSPSIVWQMWKWWMLIISILSYVCYIF
jgi:sterile alpha motif and leucine zipper-containing kinase AZK